MNHFQLKIRFANQIIFLFFSLIISLCNSDKKKNNDTVSNGTSNLQKVDVASIPREQALYLGGFQWGPPSSFNPLAVTPAWPITGNVNLVYEALFGYSVIDGKLHGIIGKSYSLNDKVLSIKLNENAQWSNGDSLTSADVIYSFNIHRKYTTNSSQIWNYIRNIRADGPNGVTIDLSDWEYNPLIIQDIIASLPILPAKSFSKIESQAFARAGMETGSTAPDNNEILAMIRENKNDSAIVASGPYTLLTYSDNLIVLVRRDNYWGITLHGDSLPSPKYIVHRSYPSNNEYNNALQSGDLDISATFFPQIWTAFPMGIKTWYKVEPYYIPGAIPTLYMGLSKAPFNDPVFRRAIAHAIDYEAIRNQAVFGYSPRLSPGMILPFGPEKQFFSDDASGSDLLYAPAKAKELLLHAGYSWGADSLLVDPSGKKIRTLSIQCPQGWTDWETTIKIVAAGLRNIGIDIKEKYVDYAVWDDELKRGMFDFTMKTPHPDQTVSLPWARFEQVMSSRNLIPVGEVSYQNEGRYRNPLADQLLAKIPSITDMQTMKQLYGQLNRLFISEMPVIPLMYRPWLFYQFNTRYWTNFPEEQNAYAPPQCLMVGAGIEGLWGIRAAKK